MRILTTCAVAAIPTVVGGAFIVNTAILLLTPMRWCCYENTIPAVAMTQLHAFLLIILDAGC